MQGKKKGVNPGLVMLATVLGIGFAGAVVSIVGGYIFGWSWAGVGSKTLWEWLQLLIIPLVLAVGGYLFTSQQNSLQRAFADQQSQLQRESADQQKQIDWDLEHDKQEESELRTYLDRMSDLILTHKLWTPPSDEPGATPPPAAPEVCELARIRTLTAVRRLNGARTGIVLQFLSEYGLVCGEHPAVSLADADLRLAELKDADLHGADLRGHVAEWGDADPGGSDRR
jgi:hypothetical protein